MGSGEPDLPGLVTYIDGMRARYPGLSERRFLLEAGVRSANFLYKLREGRVAQPRLGTLRKLAYDGVQKDHQTDKQKWDDYYQMALLAGIAIPTPDAREVTDDEWQVVQRIRSMTPEQQAQMKRILEQFRPGKFLDEAVAALHNTERLVDDSEPGRDELVGQFLSFWDRLGRREREELVATAFRYWLAEQGEDVTSASADGQSADALDASRS